MYDNVCTSGKSQAFQIVRDEQTVCIIMDTLKAGGASWYDWIGEMELVRRHRVVAGVGPLQVADPTLRRADGAGSALVYLMSLVSVEHMVLQVPFSFSFVALPRLARCALGRLLAGLPAAHFPILPGCCCFVAVAWITALLTIARRRQKYFPQAVSCITKSKMCLTTSEPGQALQCHMYGLVLG